MASVQLLKNMLSANVDYFPEGLIDAEKRNSHAVRCVKDYDTEE